MNAPEGFEQERAGRARSRRDARTLRQTILAGALGFVCGIAFWHSVGFWGLVNEAVFHARSETVDGAPVRATLAKAQSRQSGPEGPLHAEAETCSEVVIDGDVSVRVSACAPSLIKFVSPRGRGRADFADFGASPETTLLNASETVPAPGVPAVGGWAAAIAPSAPKP